LPSFQIPKGALDVQTAFFGTYARAAGAPAPRSSAELATAAAASTARFLSVSVIGRAFHGGFPERKPP
jgi:hypothetical protein